MIINVRCWIYSTPVSRYDAARKNINRKEWHGRTRVHLTPIASWRNDRENHAIISSLARVLCYITLRYVKSRNLTASKRVNRRVHTSPAINSTSARFIARGKRHLIHVYPRGQYRVCYTINATQRCQGRIQKRSGSNSDRLAVSTQRGNPLKSNLACRSSLRRM